MINNTDMESDKAEEILDEDVESWIWCAQPKNGTALDEPIENCQPAFWEQLRFNDDWQE